MTQPDRPRQLEAHLLTTAGSVRRAYDARLSEIGLNITESGLLQFLHYEQPLSQSQLAQRLYIGKMAAGSVVKGLQQRDLVSRQRDPDDGRAWLISLTTAGAKAALDCIDIDRQVVTELRSNLSKDDQRELRRLLNHLASEAARITVDAES